MLFASNLIEHDGGDLRDLPLIDRKRRLAEPVGKAREPSGRTNCISQKLESAQQALPLSVTERAKLHHSRMRPPLLMKA